MSEGAPAKPAAVERDLFGKAPKRGRDWSHRRAEPRGLVLGWTVYLLLTSAILLGPVATLGGFDPDLYRVAARRLIVMAMLGLVVLWPLVRLSQALPTRPVISVVRDLVVLLAPSAAMVLPQGPLCGWPLTVPLAVMALMTTWTLLVGAVVALAAALLPSHGSAPLGRTVAATLVLVAVGAGAIGVDAPIGRSPGLEPAAGWMRSPLTAVAEVTRDRSWAGRNAMVSAGHWEAIRRTGGAALLAWAGVLAVRVARPGRDGTDPDHEGAIASGSGAA